MTEMIDTDRTRGEVTDPEVLRECEKVTRESGREKEWEQTPKVGGEVDREKRIELERVQVKMTGINPGTIKQ